MITQLERKTAHQASELNIGDRFYFPSDKKRIVYKITYIGAKILYNRNDFELKYDQATTKNRTVIFLRHAEAEEK